MYGNSGVVNGVVIPACSIHVIPYPARTTNESLTVYANPIRGAKFFFSKSLADRPTPFAPSRSNFCVARLNTAPRSPTTVDGKFSVYRTPGFSVSRRDTRQSSCTKNSATRARGEIVSGCASRLNRPTCPNKNDANAFPVFAIAAPFAANPAVKIDVNW